MEGLRRKVEARREPPLVRLLESIGKDTADFYTRTFDYSSTINRINRTMRPELEQYFHGLYRDTARTCAPHTDAFVFLKKRGKKELDILDPAELPEYKIWMVNVAAQQVTFVSEATIAKISRIVAQSIEAGWEIERTRDAIRASGAFSKSRAEMIARTEVVSASNASMFYTVNRYYEPSETGMVKNWLATRDRRTRPTHVRAMATQQAVPFDQYFVVGGATCMFPGDSQLPARERIRCRCVATFDMTMV